MNYVLLTEITRDRSNLLEQTFNRSVPHVHKTFTRCPQDVHNMFTRCSQDVHNTFNLGMVPVESCQLHAELLDLERLNHRELLHYGDHLSQTQCCNQQVARLCSLLTLAQRHHVENGDAKTHQHHRHHHQEKISSQPELRDHMDVLIFK